MTDAIIQIHLSDYTSDLDAEQDARELSAEHDAVVDIDVDTGVTREYLREEILLSSTGWAPIHVAPTYYRPDGARRLLIWGVDRAGCEWMVRV